MLEIISYWDSLSKILFYGKSGNVFSINLYITGKKLQKYINDIVQYYLFLQTILVQY